MVKHYYLFANKTLLLYPEDTKLELLLITIATEKTDGYVRFMRTAERYGYNVRVSITIALLIENYCFFQTVGMGVEWRGGDMAHNPGGGHKINMLKPVIAEYKEKDMLIMFTDRLGLVRVRIVGEIRIPIFLVMMSC